MRRLDHYIFRLTLKPFLIVLGVAVILLILERMLRVFDLVINEGGPFFVVWKILAAVSLQYVGLALPAAVFVSALLTFRKIALNSEIDAMQASGVGVHHVVMPMAVLGVLSAAFYFALVGYIQPNNRYNFNVLLYELAQGAFGANLRVGEFNKIDQNTTLRIGQSENDGARLYDLFISREEPDDSLTTVLAREGSFLSLKNSEIVDENILVLRLKNGELVHWRNPEASPRILDFNYYDWPIKMPVTPEFRERGAMERELTMGEIWQVIRSDQSSVIKAHHRAEFHGRLSRTFMLLFLPFLAAPFGFVSKRARTGISMALGFVVLLALHKMLEFGQSMVFIDRASALVAIWLPVAAATLFSMWILWRTAYRVEGNPLLWVDRQSLKITAQLRGLRQSIGLSN